MLTSNTPPSPKDSLPPLLPDYEQEIHTLAQELGFKAANLAFLEKIGLKVPAFKGIPHSAILTHLDTYSSEWRTLWEQFKAIQKKAEQEMKAAGTPISISSDAEQALESLQNKIRQSFDDHLFNLAQEESMSHAPRLMIRSSGNEDRVDVANPGGNASLVSENKPQHLSEAIGEVIASYFSIKSLSQRLLSGEEVTQEIPKLACLAQILVGEKKEDKWPPVSGVMYTDNGDVRIHAAYGHGEYVVNSKGPADNIFVPSDDSVYSAVAEKKTRLVPELHAENQNIDLIQTPNPSHLALSPCLSDSVSQKLAAIARLIEKRYKMRMDIEFVYDPNTEEISIVQARALPEGVRQGKKPNALSKQYIANHSAEILRYRAEIITPDILFTATIDHPSQLIICQSIDQALTLWFKNKENIKGVIVQDPSPDTSHEAGMFTSQAIPVLRVDDLDTIRSLLTEENLKKNNLVLDPQNNALFQVPKEALTQTGEKSPIQEGLFKSTLSDQVSVLESSQESAESRREKLKKIESFLKKRKQYTSLEEIRADLDTLSTPSAAQKEELSSIIANLVLFTSHATIDKKSIAPQTFYKILSTADNLIHHLASINAENDSHIDPRTMTNYLHVLRKFEGLLISPAQPHIISTSALREMSKNRKETEEKFPQDLSPGQLDYYKEAIILGEHIVIKERRARWNQFCADLCKNNQGPLLATFIQKIVQQGVQEYWVNVDFWKQASVPGDRDSVEIFESLLNEYNEEKVARKRNQLLNTEKTIAAMEAHIPQFGSPQKFEKNLTTLREQIDTIEQALLAKNDINHSTEQQAPLNLMLSIHLTNRMVDALDKSIKILQMSREYTKNHTPSQTECFKKMIVLFMELLQRRVEQTPEEDPEDKRKHLGHIQTAIQLCGMTETALQISSGFNVMQANIFSGQPAENIKRVFNDINLSSQGRKRTLADIHSAIHQSLISYSESLTNTCSKESLACMPAQVQAINKEITSRRNGSTKLLSTAFKGSHVELEYNIPLHNHSSNMRIMYYPKSNTTSLSIVFYGRNHHNRWEDGAKHGIIALTSKKVHVTKYFYSDNSLIFQVHAHSTDQIKNALDVFFKIAPATLLMPNPAITKMRMAIAQTEIESSSCVEELWKSCNEGFKLRSFQKKYGIIDAQDRKALLSRIDKNRDLSNEIKQALRSENNLLLLHIGGIDLEDSNTFNLLSLTQEQFDRLTSIRFMDFYRTCCGPGQYPIKKMLGELTRPPLSNTTELTMKALTDPTLWECYAQEFFSIEELARIYQKSYEDFTDLVCSQAVTLYKAGISFSDLLRVHQKYKQEIADTNPRYAMINFNDYLARYYPAESFHISALSTLQKPLQQAPKPNTVSQQYIEEHSKEIVKNRGRIITPDILVTAMIERKKDLIVCQSIQEAFRLWETDKDIKAVIIQDCSPDTAHAVETFNTAGIPVLKVDNLQETKSLVDHTNFQQNQLILDPQQDTLFRLPKNAPMQEGLFKSTPLDTSTLPSQDSAENPADLLLFSSDLTMIKNWPATVQDLKKKLEQTDPKLTLSSETIQNGQVHLKYTQSLSNPSIDMHIIYDTKTETSSVSITFQGKNHKNWSTSAKDGMAFLTSKKIEVTTCFYHDSSVQFDVNAVSQEQMNCSLDTFFNIPVIIQYA